VVSTQSTTRYPRYIFFFFFFFIITNALKKLSSSGRGKDGVE
jgi:hypothetical protein